MMRAVILSPACDFADETVVLSSTGRIVPAGIASGALCAKHSAGASSTDAKITRFISRDLLRTELLACESGELRRAWVNCALRASLPCILSQHASPRCNQSRRSQKNSLDCDFRPLARPTRLLQCLFQP